MELNQDGDATPKPGRHDELLARVPALNHCPNHASSNWARKKEHHRDNDATEHLRAEQSHDVRKLLGIQIIRLIEIKMREQLRHNCSCRRVYLERNRNIHLEHTHVQLLVIDAS